MSDVSFARAPRWVQWLYAGFALLAANRPVVMTAGRRDRLTNDADVLQAALEVIEELKNTVQRGKATANFASHDRNLILSDFAEASPEAARIAKLESFERWNPHITDPITHPTAGSDAEGGE